MRVGSLCTGIMGAELALEAIGLEPDLAWCSEIDKSAITVIEAHQPGVSNLGDLKRIDWSAIEPVEIITAGYPCQPFSVAGKRKGTDDPRHLWPYIFDCLRVVRPRYAFLENVAGHRTLGFDQVLCDLASIGFDAAWTTLRASDIGACHRRDRLWIVATDARSTGERTDSGVPRPDEAEDEGGRQAHGHELGGHGTPGGADGGVDEQAPPHAGGSGFDSRTGLRPDEPRGIGRGRSGDDAGEVAWGMFAPAIRRWEDIFGREHPTPLEGNNHTAEFVEWMMGYPAAWVTDPSLELTRAASLRLLGNAIVPVAAAAAWSYLLEHP